MHSNFDICIILDSYLINLYKASYTSKLKPKQLQKVAPALTDFELKTPRASKLRSKSHEKNNKTVTYSMDPTNDDYNSMDDSVDATEPVILRKIKRTNINPGILKNSERDGSKMKVRNDSKENVASDSRQINRSESIENYRSESKEQLPAKGFSLKVDYEVEMERVCIRSIE